MRVTFSPSKLASCTPKPKGYEVWDTKVGGLYVRVQPTGIRSFNVFFRGKRRSIGKVGQMTIDGARFKARQILNEAAVNGWDAAAKALDTAHGKGVDTLGDFFDERYTRFAKTRHKDHEGNLEAIKVQFGYLFKKPLNRLSGEDFADYVERKLKAGITERTVSRHLSRIRAMLRHAVENKLLVTNPVVKGFRTDNNIVRFLNERDADEAQRLRRALAERDDKMRKERASANAWRKARGYPAYPDVGPDGFGDHLTVMVLTSLNTGLRRGELRQLTWADVNLGRKLLTVRAGYSKTKKARTIPMNAEAVDVLTRWKQQAPEGERIFTVLRVDKSWRAVLREAKIKDFRWHDLRHTFASWLVQGGVLLPVIRDLLGHSSITMTEKYAHVLDAHKEAAVAVLVPKEQAEAVARLVA